MDDNLKAHRPDRDGAGPTGREPVFDETFYPICRWRAKKVTAQFLRKGSSVIAGDSMQFDLKYLTINL